MPSIAVWLFGIIGALGKQAAISLGFGVVTFSSLYAIKAQLDSLISNYLGEMWGDVYNVLALAGLVDAIGIWLGAITTVLTFMTMKKLMILQ